MFPTMFRIPFLPDWLADIKSYGVMMMVAFLTGIWLACRRAVKSRANPDVVMNMGFIALILGVIGARAMYVLHYWDTRFAVKENPILEIFDIRAGGLEYLGGPILVIPALMIYLRYVAKTSIRWYLDITLPSLAWGEAIARIGCFLNGCCWGSVCALPHEGLHDKPALPWAVSFPYGSPAMVQQFKFGQLVLPKELIMVDGAGESFPVPREYLEAAVELESGRGAAERRALEEAHQELIKAQAAKLPALEQERLVAAVDAAKQRWSRATKGGSEVLTHCERYQLTPRQMMALAEHYPSQPVHPTQLYSFVNGMLLAWLLSLIFYYRRRHGVVLSAFLLIYPVSRFLLELIRQDNPLDFGGRLTISQFLGLILVILGVVYTYYIYRLPEASPRAIPFVYPDEEEKPAGRKK